MFRPRIIPALLLKNSGLVKTEKFKNHRYIGDPINAVKLFNNLKVDELCFLDIEATKENRLIDLNLLKRIADEANMPFSVGGGIKTIENIRDILSVGAEKIIISTFALQNPNFIREASREFGTSTISICIDIKKNFLGKKIIYTNNGRKSTDLDPVAFSKTIEEMGGGEIIVNSIDNDGVMNGFDIELIRTISKSVTIPVVPLGGAGKLEDFKEVVEYGYASAVAAGSFFIYKGSRRGILINYPGSETFDNLFKLKI